MWHAWFVMKYLHGTWPVWIPSFLCCFHKMLNLIRRVLSNAGSFQNKALFSMFFAFFSSSLLLLWLTFPPFKSGVLFSEHSKGSIFWYSSIAFKFYYFKTQNWEEFQYLFIRNYYEVNFYKVILSGHNNNATDDKISKLSRNWSKKRVQ